MLVYNGLFLILLLALVVIPRTSKDSNKVFWILSFIVILIPAIRDISVGTDTSNYATLFLYPGSGYDGRALELGFTLWNELISLIYNNVHFYFFISSIVQIGCVIFFIYKNSSHKLLSLFLFVVITTFYFFFFSGMRQSFALGFFLVSLNFYNLGKIKANYIKSLIFFILAVSFHTTTAYCLVVVIMLSKINISKKTAYFLLISSFIIGLFKLFDYRQLIGFAFSLLDMGDSIIERYVSYTESMDWEVSMYRRVAGMLPITLVCYICYFFATKEDIKSLYIKLLLFGVILGNVLITYPIGGRLVVYFTILVIIVFPAILHKRKKDTYLCTSILTILYFLYKANTYLMAQMHYEIGDGDIIVFYKTFFGF